MLPDALTVWFNILTYDDDTELVAQLLVPNIGPITDPVNDPVIPPIPLTFNDPVIVTSPASEIDKLFLVFSAFRISNPLVDGIICVVGLSDLRYDVVVLVGEPPNVHAYVSPKAKRNVPAYCD